MADDDFVLVTSEDLQLPPTRPVAPKPSKFMPPRATPIPVVEPIAHRGPPPLQPELTAPRGANMPPPDLNDPLDASDFTFDPPLDHAPLAEKTVAESSAIKMKSPSNKTLGLPLLLVLVGFTLLRLAFESMVRAARPARPRASQRP